ncbi:cholecystokinin receptor type A-like [Schistocerca nitens]|uniref:cholecystokinin receptor type A-like n=1 Tax=Schistocerca nitens TaxID=7011 RepID=UPI0021180B66|nr:cholecystokinin receptor type A-like [Schistocerca nitens]
MSTATDGGLPTPQLVAPPRAAARTAGLCEKQPGPRLWCMVRVPAPTDGCTGPRPTGASLRNATSLHSSVSTSAMPANSASGGGSSSGGGAGLHHSEAARLLPAGPVAKDVPSEDGDSAQPPTYTFTRLAIRSNYMDKSIEAKKKVIRMLFVVVAEFFICWAPLHVLNTWYLFSPDAVYMNVGRTGVALVHLLAYISSCCNPITYCFMNRKFRAAFLGVFGCRSHKPEWYRHRLRLPPSSGCRSSACCRGGVRAGHVCALQRPALAANSDASGNDSTQCPLRASIAARSAGETIIVIAEVLTLEAEDRV